MLQIEHMFLKTYSEGKQKLYSTSHTCIYIAKTGLKCVGSKTSA